MTKYLTNHNYSILPSVISFMLQLTTATTTARSTTTTSPNNNNTVSSCKTECCSDGDQGQPHEFLTPQVICDWIICQVSGFWGEGMKADGANSLEV